MNVDNTGALLFGFGDGTCGRWISPENPRCNCLDGCDECRFQWRSGEELMVGATIRPPLVEGYQPWRLRTRPMSALKLASGPICAFVWAVHYGCDSAAEGNGGQPWRGGGIIHTIELVDARDILRRWGEDIALRYAEPDTAARIRSMSDACMLEEGDMQTVGVLDNVEAVIARATRWRHSCVCADPDYDVGQAEERLALARANEALYRLLAPSEVDRSALPRLPREEWPP